MDVGMIAMAATMTELAAGSPSADPARARDERPAQKAPDKWLEDMRARTAKTRAEIAQLKTENERLALENAAAWDALMRRAQP